MNLWHDIEAGNKYKMNVIIEIPNGSKNKYEIDKDTGLIKLDRAMHTSQDYPFDYGFVPNTYWDDNDALDVVVLTTNPLYPGVLVHARPVGCIYFIDNGEIDDKIIAVPVEDPRFDNIKSIKDVNQHSLKEFKHFFETYKGLQHGKQEVKGLGDVDAAMDAFEKSVKMYKEKFGSYGK